MKNLLLEDIKYKIDETPRGMWRRFVYPSGEQFEEFTSHRRVFGVPLLHYTRGKCPETGKRIVARGIVAVGRMAVGVIAIGHVSAGIIALGQVALGVLFGLGQATMGVVAVGQLSVALLFGLGQVATGFVVVGQVGFGHYVLAQLGYGTHVWDIRAESPVAAQFFRQFLP